MRPIAAALLLFAFAACRPGGDERSFDLSHLDSAEAVRVMQRDIIPACATSTATVRMRGRRIAVRGTADDIACFTRTIAASSGPPAAIRLTFQVIRADGASARDSSIADIEDELRRLFRFQGYELMAQGITTAGAGAPVTMQLAGGGENYRIEGVVEEAIVRGDSGSISLQINLASQRRGLLLGTRLTITLGKTVVIGGQGSGSGPNEAVILAVRPEVVR